MRVQLVQVCVYALTIAMTWLLSARLFRIAAREARNHVVDTEVFQSEPKPSEDVLLEIYRQKYLNFRHFDILRWGVHTVVITAGGLVVTFAARTTAGGRDTETTVLFLLFGVFAVFDWWLLYRLAYNQMKNSFVLDNVARAIGDRTIPQVPDDRRSLLSSAAFMFMAFVGTLGSVAIMTALFRYFRLT